MANDQKGRLSEGRSLWERYGGVDGSGQEMVSRNFGSGYRMTRGLASTEKTRDSGLASHSLEDCVLTSFAERGSCGMTQTADRSMPEGTQLAMFIVVVIMRLPPTVMPTPDLDLPYINTVRKLAKGAVQKTESGHPRSRMALAPRTRLDRRRIGQGRHEVSGTAGRRGMKAIIRVASWNSQRLRDHADDRRSGAL